MTACLACGQQLLVATLPLWTFTIDHKVESANSRTVNAGTARWSYSKARDTWQTLFEHAMRLHRVTRAPDKRRLVLTRCYTSKQREWDYDNLVGGMKCVLDAMVKAGLLLDDNSRFVEGEYKQERTGRSGLRVDVWEVA